MLISSKITPEKVLLNGEKLNIPLNTDTDWKKEIYRHIDLNYPKFHKMDNLSKMAVLGASLIDSTEAFSTYKDDEIVLIFSNSQASSHTDNKFIDSYQSKGNPSPSLFVYTLPNILTGELAIRFKWYGENIFFIQKAFDIDLYLEQINLHFSKGAKACLCGWVECNEEVEECILFLVKKEDIPEKGEILKLFKS